MASFSVPCLKQRCFTALSSLHQFRCARVARPVYPALRSYGSNCKKSQPLDILFYGSDHFSCASLRALADEKAANPALVRSINVVVRPGKPFGRGLKQKREVPLQTLAQELDLPVYERDTNTGWTPPMPYNLIVAVSFGLLIPPRLIRAAEYGGLNLHPSMLPDFRGAAPLHHTLLQDRSHIGITLQTLHERSFDRGTVLAQTAFPGLAVPARCTLPALYDIVTQPAAEMLVAGLRAGVHVAPHAHVGWTPPVGYALREAPRLTKEDACVDWARWSAEEVERRVRVLGAAWTVLRNDKGQKLRVQLMQVTDDGMDTEDLSVPAIEERLVAVTGGNEVSVSIRRVMGDGSLVVEMPAGGLLKVTKVKVEGKSETPAGQGLGPFRHELK